MARCNRCDAPTCMYDFGPCSNYGLPGDRYNDEYANSKWPDKRTPKQIEEDRLDRLEELGEPFDFSEQLDERMMDDKTRKLLLQRWDEDIQRIEDTFKLCNAYVERKKLTSRWKPTEIGDTVTFTLPSKFIPNTK